jgi:transcriptional regulator with XRE-family HTH domain
MENTNTNWIAMNDAAIVDAIGLFVKQKRLQANKTQAQLAKEAGLNAWTISQLENGESVTLSTLIQLLRALDSLYVLDSFEERRKLVRYYMLRCKKTNVSGPVIKINRRH